MEFVFVSYVFILVSLICAFYWSLEDIINGKSLMLG